MDVRRVVDRLGWAVAVAATLALVAVLAGVVRAGPLAPPGPPGPTMKTLDEVEPRTPVSALPYVITQPGSYYVTGNLTGVPGEHGITIAASNVTLDLNGFTLTGGGGDIGIFGASGGYASVRVLDGTLAGWAQAGIEILTWRGVEVDAIRANANTHGIRVASATVRDCTAADNSGIGVSASYSSVVSCESKDNATGFSLSNSTLRDCQADANTVAGIAAGGSVVEGCVVSNNAAGIVVSMASSVRGNTVRLSAGDGIQVTGAGSMIADNVLTSNGQGGVGRGVYIAGTSNRIEGNHAQGSEQDIGFAIYGTGNTVVRNSARDNVANFDIGSGNDAAPVLAASTATNPWANLSP